jgi:hypothetical protein
MKQLGKLMLVCAGFGFLAAVLSLAPTRPAEAGGSAPVTVLNTPLPVQGTVNAAQSGTWNVGLTGTPSVNIGNTPSNPVPTLDVNQPTGEPFQEQLCIDSEAGGLCGPQDFDVPTATNKGDSVKRLVIDYVSGHCESDAQPGATLVWVGGDQSINNPSGQDYSKNYFVPVFTATGEYAFATPTRIYADPNANISIFSYAISIGSTVHGVCDVQLSGFLMTH